MPKKKRREDRSPRRAPDLPAKHPCYLQLFLPAGPVHLPEQHWEFAVQLAPLPPQEQEGEPEQFESAQSVNPSQSLSTPSLQTSVEGTQVLPARKGATEL